MVDPDQVSAYHGISDGTKDQNSPFQITSKGDCITTPNVVGVNVSDSDVLNSRSEMRCEASIALRT